MIDYLSRVFKTDVRYIFSGSAAMTVGQTLVACSALCLSIAFANLLPKNLYGSFQYILSITELIAVVSLTGLGTSLIRSVAQGYDGEYKKGFRTSLVWSSVSILGGLCIGGYYIFQSDYTFGISILLASILLPLITASKLYMSFLNGKKLFKTSATLKIISNVFPAIILIGTLFYTNDVLILIAIYLISHTLINFLLYFYCQKYIENDKVSTETIGLATHLSLQNLIARSAAHIDKIILFQFTGAIALAEYLFAIAVPRQVQHMFKSAKSIVLPKVSNRSLSQLKKTLIKKIALLYLFLIPITFGYIALAPFIFQMLFPQYIDSVFFSQLYALIFLLMPFNVFTDALTGHAKNKSLYITKTSTAVCKIIMTILLVPSFGIIGLVSSVLITQAIFSILVTFQFYRSED